MAFIHDESLLVEFPQTRVIVSLKSQGHTVKVRLCAKGSHYECFKTIITSTCDLISKLILSYTVKIKLCVNVILCVGHTAMIAMCINATPCVKVTKCNQGFTLCICQMMIGSYFYG